MIVLALLGIIATWFYGVKARRRIQLAFYEESCISLFESIVQSLEGIEINYEKKPISQNLVLLKGCIVNTGNTDIDKNLIHKPLTLRLPSSFKWLRASIVSSSPDVNAIYELSDPNGLTFRWDLLKPNEYFRFDALAETPAKHGNGEKAQSPGRALEKNVDLTFRISGLSSVDEERIHFPTRLSIGDVSHWVFWFLIGLLYIIIAFTRYYPEKLIHYKLEQSNGDKIEVSMEGTETGHILLKEVGGAFTDTIEASALFVKYKVTPLVVTRWSSFYFYLGSGILLSTVVGWSVIGHIQRTKRARKRLRLVDLVK
jgi:hypothetical protein